MATESDKPDVTEVYRVAAGTSNLRVEADRRGAGDILIAAGWNHSRLGMALLRLASEWDSAAKPRKIGPAQIKALSLTMPGANGKPDIMRARREAAAWYASELRLLAQSLKSRATVLEQLMLWASLKGVRGDTVSLALMHWLDHACKVCDGHGLLKAPDSPALSARRCHACHGTGSVTEPDGAARVIGYVEYCLNAARSSLKQRLRG